MSGKHPILDETAKRTITEAVRAVEARTSAEIVVALRPSSASYRHADYLAGFLVSFAVLLVLLFAPVEFPVETMPVDALVGFGLGILLSTAVSPLKRLLTLAKERRRAVELAARGAFVDRGVSRTKARSGILLYVSRFERAVAVVADVGIDVAALGDKWTAAIRALEQTLHGRFDAARFAAALTALGPILEGPLPRSADDVNELPDEVA